jgi:hypothetical protein
MLTARKEYIPDNECKDQDHDNRGELHGIAAATRMMVRVGGLLVVV